MPTKDLNRVAINGDFWREISQKIRQENVSGIKIPLMQAGIINAPKNAK
jgi:hypothetical protein